MRATIVLVAIFLSSAILASATGATVTWLRVNPPSSPSARASMAMAYDPVSKKVVLFGGFDATGYLNDTWLFDGQTWSQASSPSAPSPRAASAMSFDRIAGKLVMFGGFNGSQYIGDTWIWDGVSETWTQASPSTLPTPVTLPMMFTDPKNGHAEMFGGFDGNFYQLTTWQWTGGNWINRKPANFPSARGAAIVANDFAHNNVVLYGGLADVNPLNTWTWDGTNWTQQNPAVQPDSTYYSAAAYDPMLGEVVMFSGSSGFNTTWAWTGTNWVTVNTVNAPLARESTGMAYDNDSQQLLIFGGDVPQGVMNDTYKLVKRQ
jgi:hypothetical protein